MGASQSNALSAEPSTRRRSSAYRTLARSGATAVDMQSEMWLMPVADFVALSTLEPHQKMLEQKKLVRWDSSMRHVLFVSHQWTSFDHPDHTHQQLRTMQRLLVRMFCGQCPDTAPVFADAAVFPKSVRVTTAEWQRIVPDAFIWMDYFSV